jgi:hypothetical protein
MTCKAVYENGAGQTLEIEIATDSVSRKSYLQTEDGRSVPFTPTIEDSQHGTMTYINTIEDRQLPRPTDPEREKTIQAFKVKLRTRFKSNESFQNFLDSEAGLRQAIDTDFLGVPIAKIGEWSARITAAVAAPEFTVEEKRRRFTGVELGDLFIENEKIPSSASNDWCGVYAVRCQRCRKLEGEIKVVDILRMQRGLIPLWKCGNPCGRGR